MTTDEETPVRRRRRRGRRAGRRRNPVAPDVQEEEGALPSSLGWQWRTFPVFFAFVCGMLLMALAWPIPGIGTTFFFVGIGGVAYGLAHILTHWFIARRRG